MPIFWIVDYCKSSKIQVSGRFFAPSYRKNDLENAIDKNNLSVKNSKINAAFLINIE